MWISKSRNVIKKKENGLMRILQAAYACIMRETEEHDNKRIEVAGSVWRQSDGRLLSL